MLIGLDVGGTHTDAVLIHADSAAIVNAVKVPTQRESVLPGIVEALENVLEGHPPGKVRRVTVSSTLGLNALLTGNGARVGMLVVPGPGIDPALFWGPDPLFYSLSGALDHRGRLIARPDEQEIRDAISHIRAQGAEAVCVVCKFSPKNTGLEEELREMAQEVFGPATPVVTGASAGGSLNFPRRMHTAWCNAALTNISKDFTCALKGAAVRLGLACPLAVLKADAGVFSLERSAADPASSMGSGPAASLLGVWAFASREHAAAERDLLMIDMGGTTTDLALTFRGHPLLAPEGLRVQGRPTLIRSLWTRSIPLGGDSSLRIEEGRLSVGPDRSGPALALDAKALGQRPPTLTDALNVLELADTGNREHSFQALQTLASQSGSPVPDARPLAALFVQNTLERIKSETEALLAEVNARPVYTIRELLVESGIRPGAAVFIGGPAKALARSAGEALGLPVFVPEESAVANALGAALARPTATADLYADTLLGHMSIPDFGVERTIDRNYGLEQARRDMLDAFRSGNDSSTALAWTEGDAPSSAPEPQTVFAESFAMLDDRGGRGRTIRLRMQQPAGLLFH